MRSDGRTHDGAVHVQIVIDAWWQIGFKSPRTQFQYCLLENLLRRGRIIPMPSLLEKCDKCGGRLGFCRLPSTKQKQPYPVFQWCNACKRRVGNGLPESLLQSLCVNRNVLPLAPPKETRRSKAKVRERQPQNVDWYKDPPNINTPEVQALRDLPYPEYLKTDHWKRMRAICLARFGNRCAICHALGMIHVHHRTYMRRGCELPEDLTALCKKCHDLYELNKKGISSWSAG